MNNEVSQDAGSSEVQHLAGRYMSFLLAGEEYGIGILKVREIISLQESTPIPRMPEFVKGVINLRGRIVPLVDLRLKLGLEVSENTAETCIIVTEVDRGEGELMQIGCIVDAVSEVVDMSARQLEPAPSLGRDVDCSFILALGKSDSANKVVTLIDLDAVLADLVESTAKSIEQQEAA